MKRSFLFLILFAMLIISGCDFLSFKYEVSFESHDGVVSTSCDKKNCVYKKGDKATITIETSRHYQELKNNA